MYEIGKTVEKGGKIYIITGVSPDGKSITSVKLYSEGTGETKPATSTEPKTEKDIRFQQYQGEYLEAARKKGYGVRENKTKYDPYGKQSYDPNTGGYTYNDQALDWNDFKERHNELISEEIGSYGDWESRVKSRDAKTREQAVRQFQTAYNKWYQDATGKTYFEGDVAKSPYGVDSKFGIYTSSAPGLSKPKKPPVEDPKPVNNAPAVPTQPMGRQGEIPTVGPFPQDQMQLLGALGDFASVRKYMPWEPVVDLENVDPTFYDPSRELANLNEQIAIGTQGAMTFANPQAYNAGFSQIQGKAAAGAADIMGRYNNLNVGVANQFALTNNQINNTEAQANAQRQLSLYDKNTVANQQYDNAKRDAKWRTINSMNNMITNTAMANTLNYMNPYEFFLDPSTGGTIKLNQDNLPELDKNYRSELESRKQAWAEIQKDPTLGDNDAKQRFFETMYGPAPSNPQFTRRGSRANQVDVEGLLRLMQSGFNYNSGPQT